MSYTKTVELGDLNSEQLRAVKHFEGPMLVVAGAGTGKTQVITQRIAHLIKEHQIEPGQILALTFTEKAAGEMLDRLDRLVGWQAYQVNVMTFHAFGAQVLQRFGHHLGLPISGEVITDIAKVLLIKQQLSKIQLNYYGNGDLVEFANQTVRYIEALQNADITVEEFSAYVDELRQSKAHKLDVAEAEDRLKLYQLYEEIKRHYRLIDYHDQIALTLRLLKERPNVLQRLRQLYQHVLVDEYQDTNGDQDELLRLLIKPGGNIFAVGDDDQAIYGFRGAKLTNILGFSEHFGVKAPIVLTKNYRSTQEILDAAYRMIRHNDPERLEVKLGIDKRLISDSHGSGPKFVGFSDWASECDGVANLIRADLADGLKTDQIAILATSHRVLRTQARVLKRSGLPYRLVSLLNIFEQREVLQLWHLLRWIGLAADDEAIMNLMHGPFVGWESAWVRQLVDDSRKRLIGLEAALEIAAKSDQRASTLVEQLKLWRQWSKELSIGHLAYRLVFESGLGQSWVNQAAETPRMVRMFEDLQLWFKQIQQFEQVAVDTHLHGYLETFPRPPEIEAEEAVGDEHGITLLTVHAAKGLEFESVYLTNTTAEAWSGSLLGQVELPSGLVKEPELPPEHERRRLLYVAITRAKSRLTISAPVQSGDGRPRRTNQLLAEVFGELPKPTKTVATTDRLSKSLLSLEQYAPATMRYEAERLPFETVNGWLELTTTDLERYDFCPYEFYLERILKIRTPFGPQIAFGSLLHSLFHDYYQARLTKDPLKLDELLVRLDASWTDQGYRTAEEAQIGRQSAKETLINFYHREEQTKRVIRSSEESFGLVIDEAKLRLRGRIDASFVTPDGIEVRDFKTGRKRDDEKLGADAKKSLQLRTYAMAIQEMTGQRPSQVVLDYVVTGVEGVAELSGQILKNHRQKLAKLAESIRQKEFAPNPDPFHNCASYRYWGSGDSEDA